MAPTVEGQEEKIRMIKSKTPKRTEQPDDTKAHNRQHYLERT